MKRAPLTLALWLIAGPALAYSHGTPPVIPTLSPGGGYTSGSPSHCYASQAYGVTIANSATSPQPSALNGQIPNNGWFADNSTSGSATVGCPTPSTTTVTGPTATGLLDVIVGEGIDDPNGIYVTLVDGVQDRQWIDHAEFWFEGNKITVGNQGAGRMISPTNLQSYGWVVRLTSGAGQNGLATVCGHSVPKAATEGDRWVCKTVFINTNASGAGYINRSLSAKNYYANPYTGNDTWDGTAATHTGGTTGPWATALYHLGANAASFAGFTHYVPDNSGAVLNLASHGVATTTFSANTLTITGSLTGEFSVGDFVVGANLPPGMLLTSGGTCTSGAVVPPCTFITNIAFPVSGSGSVTAAGMYQEPNLVSGSWVNTNISHETIPFKVTTATQYGAVIQSPNLNGIGSYGATWNNPVDLVQYDNIVFDKTALGEFWARPYNDATTTANAMWLSNGAVWEEYPIGCSTQTMCIGYTDLVPGGKGNVETSNTFFSTNFTDGAKTYRGDVGYYSSIAFTTQNINDSNFGIFGYRAAGSGTMFYNYFNWASSTLSQPASYFQPVITAITFATDATYCPFGSNATGCLEVTIDNATGANANISSVSGANPYTGGNTAYEVCFLTGPQFNGGRQPYVRPYPSAQAPLGAEQGCVPFVGFNGSGPWNFWIAAPNMLTGAGFVATNCAPASGSFSGNGQTLTPGTNCPVVGNTLLPGQTRHGDFITFSNINATGIFGPDNIVISGLVSMAGDEQFLVQSCGDCAASGATNTISTTTSGSTAFTIANSNSGGQAPLPGDIIMISDPANSVYGATQVVTSVSSVSAGTLRGPFAAPNTVVTTGALSSNPLAGSASDRTAITTTLAAGTYNFVVKAKISVTGDYVTAQTICYASTATPPACDNTPIPMTFTGQVGCNPCTGYNGDLTNYTSDPISMTIPANATIIVTRDHPTSFTINRNSDSGFTGWFYNAPQSGAQSPGCSTGCTAQSGYDLGVLSLQYTNPAADISGAQWTVIKAVNHLLVENTVLYGNYATTWGDTSGIVDGTFIQDTFWQISSFGCNNNPNPGNNGAYLCSAWLSSYDSIWPQIDFTSAAVPTNWNMDTNTFLAFFPVGTNGAQAAGVTFANTGYTNYATMSAHPTGITQLLAGGTNGLPLVGVDSVGNPLTVGASIVGAQQ